MPSNKKIGFIGAGSMAEALIKGILNSGIFLPNQIYISDIKAERLDLLKDKYQVIIAKDNFELLKNVDYIIMAVKPKVIPVVLKELEEDIDQSQKIFSIAAGVTTKMIKEYLSSNNTVVRLMPNTPALIGEGAIAYTVGSDFEAEDKELVEEIFSSVGNVVEVEEDLMDAVTGLSGSGPAYIYLIIEALADAGVNVGLSRDNALELALQTIIGSAKMVLELEKHPAQLKDMVTSPGGTTITGLKILEEKGVRSAFYSAIEAATLKSKELRGEE
ncbi:pyrroline-5-carboxylate reductase [Orenia marismortui]|uniref:Pyrroline-5-carboxylate reductase n=1 Tax=Orenia marismortui TaxID=46469 RepID=A0A4R8GLC7_9FIRM|nr:pyrroline-5-carboxylate reductase [Orenia marismortui]TDX46472.1 pyrroline-5-carboxylate reductase [Orenia marismortui]